MPLIGSAGGSDWITRRSRQWLCLLELGIGPCQEALDIVANSKAMSLFEL